MKFILGKKLSMTQIFSATGEVVPVTKIEAGPCSVVQVKTTEKDNSNAVQIGFGERKKYLVKKPLAGHLKDLPNHRWLKDFELDGQNVKRGDVITAATFSEGDKVTVIGQSKGRGFAGVVKRHHFRGGPASHGHKDNLRAPGSIGAGGVQRVFKGMRMAGHMGVDQVTVKNLEVVKVDSENNEIYLKGAVPGARGGLVMIYSPGELKIQEVKIEEVKPEEKVEVVVAEEATTETSTTETTKTEESTSATAPAVKEEQV